MANQKIKTLLEQLANAEYYNSEYDPHLLKYITNKPPHFPRPFAKKYDLDKRIQEANIPKDLEVELKTEGPYVDVLSALDAPLFQKRNRHKFPPLMSGEYPHKVDFETHVARASAIDDETNILDIIQQRDILHYLINAMSESQNIFGKGVMGADPNIMDEFLKETSIMSQMIGESINPNEEQINKLKKKREENYIKAHKEFPHEFPLE